jgi:glycosyltransferase involved in cell wall biosynthesis
MLPRISVITCSYNQGRFIARTIDSVLAQNYPNVEHIVVDGMSTDDTPIILARYSQLRVIREPDSGQAEAINKGFRAATGDILCFLNSDDVFYPGALHRVAAEINPRRGRHVVLGRCLFIDENDGSTGVEHPSDFRGLEQVLRVWKVHCIPQPATFWTREVWERCGPLDEAEHLVLDFDLMCRIARRYRFHQLDQVVAGYRLHNSSKSCSNDAQKIYDTAIRASQRYWGGPWTLRYWRLRWSLALHRHEQRTGHARQSAHEVILSEQAWQQGRKREAVARLARAARLAPGHALRRWCLLNLGQPLAPLTRLLAPIRTWQGRRVPGHTTAWRAFTGAHGDGAVGPHYAVDIDLSAASRSVRVSGLPIVPWVRGAIDMKVHLDGETVLHHRWQYGQPFSLEVPVEGRTPGRHRLEIFCGGFVIPSDILGGEDHRPLTFRLGEVRVVEENARTLRAAA